MHFSGASLSLETKRWSLQVWGKNLTATRYYTFYFMSMGNEFLQRGRPVQAGVTSESTYRSRKRAWKLTFCRND